MKHGLDPDQIQTLGVNNNKGHIAHAREFHTGRPQANNWGIALEFPGSKTHM
jgi:hypothetical protein